ncbi:MAG: hypothetical protein JWR21_3124 [Herminiimonas sp.]|nr:hypothetical protein [Herminiimonas sp.]
MSHSATPKIFLEKSERALRGARLLLDAGEIEGACNRAYYAMYDAAHAALMSEHQDDYKVTKTHSGLIAAFGMHIVATGKLPRELGRTLNEVEQVRLLADYTGEEISVFQATKAVGQAEAFVLAIRELLEQ